jgi:hypothetical protein
MLKPGVDFKPANGFHLFGNFTRVNTGSLSDYVNLVSASTSLTSAQDILIRLTSLPIDNSFTSYKSAGQNISLSFNLKKKMIVRESKIYELTLSSLPGLFD